jgi:2-polyprenyl-6-hydroxyphenyl methylase/3-demethylubiquinone-9 3-methyltransferase
MKDRKFSFGKNWRDYLESISEDRIQAARVDIEKWLGKDSVKNKIVLDIGSGSGIHSLAFYLLGAKEILSIDVDENSVAATKSLWEKYNKPGNWEIMHASILDEEFIQKSKTRQFDIVYSWGVLHHTGDMWKAMENSCKFIKKNGLFWIALYVKGPRYKRDLALKQKYNRSSGFGKWLIKMRFLSREYLKLLLFRDFKKIKNRLLKKEKYLSRGMDVKHDIEDWLGGLPYEVASVAEIVEFTRKKGMILEKIETGFEGGNNVCLLSKPGS